MKAQLALRMKYRLRRYESGTACRMRSARRADLQKNAPVSFLTGGIFVIRGAAGAAPGLDFIRN